MKRKKKKKLFLLFILLLLIGAGVAAAFIFLNKDDTKKTISDIIPIKEKEPEVKIVDLKSKSRPIAVMINNHNDARRVQSGLSEAYMVYEIIAEGGVTRYMALFKDVNPERIGSVRSSRHYFLDYALENDAVYVHWGWSPQAQSDIKALKINNINGLTYEGKYFYRYNPYSIAVEHTGFTDMEKIKSAMEKLNYRDTTDKGVLLDYSAKSIDLTKYGEVEDANTVTITYSGYVTNKYVYDEENKVYNRFANNKEQIDMNTNKQLTVKNIIVYEVANSAISGDYKNRQTIDNIGKGEGYYISEGKASKITWEKTSREGKTIYKYENGDKLVVNDGNTFIQIMPTTGKLVIE